MPEENTLLKSLHDLSVASQQLERKHARVHNETYGASRKSSSEKLETPRAAGSPLVHVSTCSERNRDRESERRKEPKRKTGSVCVYIYICVCIYM